MKNLFKDRKTLYLVLGLVMISVFTLTVVYAALNTVLTISGNARVSAADWDIYLNNARVTNGSATTDVPEIKTSSTLEFSTTLNMPGDFYEFIVDVVNGGDIDAMIENVVKNPELTTEQAKYLKYEITYQNGESITTKQLLAKDSTMPIKVRIEYRKDLNNSDLPTGQVVLDLALTLEYVQSDGTGSSVKDNGVELVKVVSGDGTKTSDEVCIEEECFYVISSTEETVTMLAKYNLYVGGSYDKSTSTLTTYGGEATGKQNSKILGFESGKTLWNGVTPFSSENYWYNGGLKVEYGTSYPVYVYDSNSLLYEYIENYKSYLSGLGVTPSEARIISFEELETLGCERGDGSCSAAHEWVYATSYWTGSANDSSHLWVVNNEGGLDGRFFSYSNYAIYGCRPVIVISKDYFLS